MSNTIIQALGIDLDDPEPFAPRRQEKLINALFTIGERNGVLPDPFVRYVPKVSDASEVGDGAKESDEDSAGGALEATSEDESLSSHFFGMLAFNDLKCNQCGICAVVCKHDAMKRSERKTSEGKTYFIEFTPSKCVQCRLCEEACFRKAVTVSNKTPFAALFSFEPVCYK